MVFGLLNQLQIFWQFCLLELLGILTGLGLLQLKYLIYPRPFDRVWHAGLLHKLKSYGILGQIFGRISSIVSVIDSLGSGWELFLRISS